MNTCPVCDYAELDVPPYANIAQFSADQIKQLSAPYENTLGKPSYEVCPKCGFEFGNDDNPGTAAPVSFAEYRERWTLEGSVWFDATVKLRSEFERVYAQAAGVQPNGSDTAWVHIEGQPLRYLYDIARALEVLRKHTDGSAQTEAGALDVITDFEESGAFLNQSEEMRNDDYTILPGLSDIYLEDSWVVAIDEESNRLRFTLEAVLTKSHPAYTSPKTGEQYCYRLGTLVFNNTAAINWVVKTDDIAYDASGEPDHGHIDTFVTTGNGYYLEGQFGKVQIITKEQPSFELD